MKDLLLYFGICAFVWPLYDITSTFLRRKRHLCSSLNAVLAGYSVFIGISTIAFARQSGAVQTPYASYKLEYAVEFCVSIVLFTVVLMVTYTKSKLPRVLLKFLSIAPPKKPRQAMIMTLFVFALAIACLLPRFNVSIPVITNVLVRCLSASIIFSCVYALSTWWSDRSNVLALMLFLFVFASCLIFSVILGSGRRGILGVVLASGIYIYWKKHNVINREKIAVLGASFLIIVFVFINGYNNVRRMRISSQDEGFISEPLAKLRALPNAIFSLNFFDEQIISDIGQNATNCSLYSIHLGKHLDRPNKSLGLKYPSYLHSTLFAVVNPIPRQFWENKPTALGFMLPQHLNPGTRVNWGPGLAGHFFHEGGYLAAIFYGLLLGFILKCIDQYVQMNTGNVLAIGLLASSFPQLILVPRGDLAIALLNVVFCLVIWFSTRSAELFIYGKSLATTGPQGSALQSNRISAS